MSMLSRLHAVSITHAFSLSHTMHYTVNSIQFGWQILPGKIQGSFAYQVINIKLSKFFPYLLSYSGASQWKHTIWRSENLSSCRLCKCKVSSGFSVPKLWNQFIFTDLFNEDISDVAILKHGVQVPVSKWDRPVVWEVTILQHEPAFLIALDVVGPFVQPALVLVQLMTTATTVRHHLEHSITFTTLQQCAARQTFYTHTHAQAQAHAHAHAQE